MTSPDALTLLDAAVRYLERAVAELDAGRPARRLVRDALAHVRAARRLVRLADAP